MLLAAVDHLHGRVVFLAAGGRIGLLARVHIFLGRLPADALVDRCLRRRERRILPSAALAARRQQDDQGNKPEATRHIDCYVIDLGSYIATLGVPATAKLLQVDRGGQSR